MRFIKLIILFLLTQAAYAASNSDVIFTEDRLGQLITPAHPEFIIKLHSNPTTGYSWFLREYNANYLSPVRHAYEGPSSKLIGAGGYEVWHFKLKPEAFTVPQQTIIRFVYTRPWEGKNRAKQLVFRISTVSSGPGY